PPAARRRRARYRGMGPVRLALSRSELAGGALVFCRDVLLPPRAGGDQLLWTPGRGRQGSVWAAKSGEPDGPQGRGAAAGAPAGGDARERLAAGPPSLAGARPL